MAHACWSRLVWTGVLAFVAGCAGSGGGDGGAGGGSGGGQGGGQGGGGTSSSTSALVITPSADFKLAVGGEVDLVARVHDAAGAIVVNSAATPVFVDWQSSDPTVVSVDEDGLVRGVGPGAATVTAAVRGSTDTVSVGISVQPADMAAIFIDPGRLVLDVGAMRDLKVTAVDSAGAPTTLDCGSAGVVLGSNTEVLTATYDGTLGAEKLVVQGVKKGLTVLTLNCAGFEATPVIIEVKPPVTIPKPTGSTNPDFGLYPSLVVRQDQIHLSSFDRQNGKLVYTHFQGVWSSEVLDGVGVYGQHSQVVLDPLNGERPLVCAQEDGGLTCWALGSGGFWLKHRVALEAADAPVRLAVNSAGVVYLSFRQGPALMLAQSSSQARDDWRTTQLAMGTDLDFYDMALWTDGLPRFAVRHRSQALFGSLDATGKASFEVVDATAGTPPPGAGIRLAISADNRPHVLFAKNGNLIHARRSAGQWGLAVIATTSTGPEHRFGWAVDDYHQPRVAYFDTNERTLKHGVRLRGTRLNATNHWRLDRPSARVDIGAYNAMVVDHLGRSQIAYYDEGRATLGYSVDPLPLDYAAVDTSDVEPEGNTRVTGGRSLAGCYLFTVGTNPNQFHLSDGDVAIPWGPSAAYHTGLEWATTGEYGSMYARPSGATVGDAVILSWAGTELRRVTGALAIGSSPTQPRFAYVQPPSGNGELWVAAPDGTNAVKVSGSTPVFNSKAAWLADGNGLLFQGGNHVFRVRPDGTGLVDLTPTSTGNSVAFWTTTGYLFVRDTDAGQARLRRGALDGTGFIDVVTGAAASRPIQFSPDGARLATYTGSTEPFAFQVADSAFQNPVTLYSFTSASNEFPTMGWRFSPTGDRLAICRRDSVWVFPANGAGAGVQLWSGQSPGPGCGVWAPDGSAFAFLGQTLSSSGYLLYAANANGTGLAQLSPAGADSASDYSWTPNSAEILFRVSTAGSSEVYVVKRDGTGLKHLNATLGSAGSPGGVVQAPWCR